MNQYSPPTINSDHGSANKLKDINGKALVVSMDVPWRLLQDHIDWEPDHVHMIANMDKSTVENLDEQLPECDTVIGVGGGSAMDTAKYLAWKRGCRMILVPTIISVDAPLTNTIAVRVDKTVEYIGDIYPSEIIVDYGLIQKAPKELNRAGACDIASIHTALYDWKLAHDNTGEQYDEAVAQEARECLEELDRNADEVYKVTPKGIDTIVHLYRREVEFCARFGNSRPEEGSEHIVCYNIEHITRRHFIHGDLVGLGIFMMSRLQNNNHEWAVDLMERCGLRYKCPDASRQEVRETMETLKDFKERTGLFYSVVDTEPITEAFINDAMNALG